MLSITYPVIWFTLHSIIIRNADPPAAKMILINTYDTYSSSIPMAGIRHHNNFTYITSYIIFEYCQ
jgi:hypothetical protein